MLRIRRALLGCCVGAAVAAAWFVNAEEDPTRSVTILDGAPLAAPAPELPAAAVPDSPAPPPPPMDKPSNSGPAPAAPPAQSAPQIETVTVPSVAPKPPDVPRKGSPAPIRLANSAELAVEMTPGGTLSVGSRVSFRITSRKAGYVVLVDVDATGKLTQIYPNAVSPAGTTRSNVNYIKPGVPLLTPSATDALAGVAYVVSPPVGSAMVIAIWSEQAVQSLDLPDVPVDVKGQTEALDYLIKRANELRIPDARSGRLREANWSFDAKFYAIR
jgi:Domain of unknown function (DUF4384)